MAVDKAHLERLVTVATRVKHVHESEKDLLNGIRNNTIGHRDYDASEQIEWLTRVRPAEIRDFGYEVLALNTALTDVIMSIDQAGPTPAVNSRGDS